ncbi:MAG: HD-GYP domain-containing protein [Bdellovibrionia bacterium]
MNIILLQENLEIANKNTFLLEKKHNVSIHIAKSISEAKNAITQPNASIDLMIIDYDPKRLCNEVDFWNEASKFLIVMTDQSALGSVPMKNNQSRIVKPAKLLEAAEEMIAQVLKNKQLGPVSTTHPYCRIKTELLLSVAPLAGDIFIKLSESKFVKVFQKGDVFRAEDFNKYTRKKGVEYLYILREQCDELASKYLNQLKKMINSEPLTLDAQLRALEDGTEMIHQIFKQIGFGANLQELIRSHCLFMLKIIGTRPDLGAVIHHIKKVKGDFIPLHSTYTAFTCCALAQKMGWASELTYHKLCLASILHDLTLDHSELAQIRTLKEIDLAKSKYSPEEIQALRDHSEAMAKLVQDMTGIPPEVDMIIRAHHELPDATGFPLQLNQNKIAPLASLFIFGHSLTQDVLIAGEYFDLEQHLRQTESQFQSGFCRKILLAIHKTN